LHVFCILFLHIFCIFIQFYCTCPWPGFSTCARGCPLTPLLACQWQPRQSLSLDPSRSSHTTSTLSTTMLPAPLKLTSVSSGTLLSHISSTCKQNCQCQKQQVAINCLLGSEPCHILPESRLCDQWIVVVLPCITRKQIVSEQSQKEQYSNMQCQRNKQQQCSKIDRCSYLRGRGVAIFLICCCLKFESQPNHQPCRGGGAFSCSAELQTSGRSCWCSSPCYTLHLLLVY
jgi:hypothetical protein